MPRLNRLYCEKSSWDATSHLPVVEVSVDFLRDMFNHGRYYERFTEGEYIACLRKEGVPSSVDEPPHTRSLTIDYMERDGMRGCRVHMYPRPDGSPGGRGGRPDPKQIVRGGKKYVLA
jgi:hypothetical protein